MLPESASDGPILTLQKGNGECYIWVSSFYFGCPSKACHILSRTSSLQDLRKSFYKFPHSFSSIKGPIWASSCGMSHHFPDGKQVTSTAQSGHLVPSPCLITFWLLFLPLTFIHTLTLVKQLWQSLYHWLQLLGLTFWEDVFVGFLPKRRPIVST